MAIPRTYVAVIEQNPIYREGLLRILGRAGLRPAGHFASLDELLTSSVRALDPLLVLMDVGDGSSSIASAVVELRAHHEGAKIVLMADSLGDHLLIEAFRSGADGLVLKPIGCEALVKSLELVMLGERVFPIQVFRALSSPPQVPNARLELDSRSMERLSLREIEVLQCLSSGSPNKVIARRFGITEATVKVHVKAILRKIPAKNRTEAAIWARNHHVERDAAVRSDTSVPLNS